MSLGFREDRRVKDYYGFGCSLQSAGFGFMVLGRKGFKLIDCLIHFCSVCVCACGCVLE